MAGQKVKVEPSERKARKREKPKDRASAEAWNQYLVSIMASA